MKKQKKELLRLKDIVDSDRINTSQYFITLVESDLKKVLGEYFEFLTFPTLCINKSQLGIDISIDFSASSIKNFNTIPE